MTDDENMNKRRRWRWKPFLLAVYVFISGFVCAFVGLATALGAGSSGVRDDDWLVPIGEYLMFIGPCLAIIGLLWMLGLILRRFWPVRKK